MDLEVGALAPLFEHAADHPDEWAIVEPAEVWSWAEAAATIAQTANALLEADLPERRRIAVIGENTASTLVFYAGALLAGFGTILVNQQLTASEIVHMLIDGDAGALWTDEVHVPVAQLAVAQIPAVHLLVGATNSPWSQAVARAAETPPSMERPIETDLGYTSGTTGRPKGVAVPRGAIGTVRERVALATRHHSVRLGPHLVSGPLYHGGPHAAVGLLLTGTPIVLIGRFDAVRALEAIDRFGVATSVMVPTHFSRLLQLDEDERRHFDVSSLRLVIHTGSPCPHSVKRAMIEWWGPVLRETYGGIESGVVAGISTEEWMTHPGSAGRAVPPYEILIIREDGTTGAVGEDGVIYFYDPSGLGVTYRNDPDKTAAVHIAPGTFTLGDIGHLDADGYLYLTTRRDDLVLSGGVNVYPAEAEAALVEHPAVIEAACFGVADADLGERLIGVVTVTEDSVAAEDILSFCCSRLARHKAPRQLHIVSEIPMNAMGKVDRKHLKAAYETRSEPRTAS